MNIKSSISQATKIIILIILVVLVSGCKEQIMHNLSESDVNRLLTKLHDGGINSSKVKQPDGKWALAVSDDDAVAALRYLSDTRSLRDISSQSLPEASLVSSREDQRFRFERSLAKEIEQTLSSIEGVLESRVHLNMPPTDPLFGQPMNRDQGSASVLLIATKDFPVVANELSALVSGASGIPASNISVLINKNHTGEQVPVGQIVSVPSIEGKLPVNITEPHLSESMNANIDNSTSALFSSLLGTLTFKRFIWEIIGTLFVLSIFVCGHFWRKRIRRINADQLNSKLKPIGQNL